MICRLQYSGTGGALAIEHLACCTPARTWRGRLLERGSVPGVGLAPTVLWARFVLESVPTARTKQETGP